MLSEEHFMNHGRTAFKEINSKRLAGRSKYDRYDRHLMHVHCMR